MSYQLHRELAEATAALQEAIAKHGASSPEVSQACEALAEAQRRYNLAQASRAASEAASAINQLKASLDAVLSSMDPQ